jgi:hypothetical protein
MEKTPPRAVILHLYAEAKGLDPRALLQMHVQYLKTFQYWILERLELLGYSINIDAKHHAELLGLRPGEVAEAVDAVLEVFRSKPESAAALPPLLTLPEKLVVVEAAAPRLKEVLRLLIQRRKVSNVWESWLYVLHLAAHGRPTRLGRALYKALKEGREPGRAYVEEAEKLWLLRWIIALEAAALDVGTKNELDALLAAYAKRIPGVDLYPAYSAFRYMASDVKGIAMTTPALPPEKIFELLGQL